MDEKKVEKTIKLQDININKGFRVRDIDPHVVKVFKDRRKTGVDLTSKEPFVLDQDYNLISGHHRYIALMTIDPGCKVRVHVKKYRSIKERLIDAGALNNENGFPLQEYEEKRLAFRLRDMSASEDEIVTATGRPMTVVDRWFGQAVIVLYPDGRKEQKARKGGLSKTIKELTEEQYAAVDKKGSGWFPIFHADQVLFHIRNNTVDLSDEATVRKLVELHKVVGLVLSGLQKEATA